MNKAYDILTIEEIVKLVNEKWEPYRFIYTSKDELDKILHKETIEQLSDIVSSDDLIKSIIPEPKTIDEKKEYNSVYSYNVKLCKLRSKQIRLHNLDYSCEEFIELANEVQELYSELIIPNEAVAIQNLNITTEYLEDVYTILKRYFNDEDHENLYKLLSTGTNLTNKITFLESGNKLADAFKQLCNAKIIVCKKIDLEGWIKSNFKYVFLKKERFYTSRYLNDIISSNDDQCKRPILKVQRNSTNGKKKVLEL